MPWTIPTMASQLPVFILYLMLQLINTTWIEERFSVLMH